MEETTMQKTERTERQDVYTRITAQIVADLEKGVRPWVKPWNAEHAAGRITRPLRHNGQPYSGINILSLWMSATVQNFAAPIWMTFRQALELDAHVRKGEKGSLVVYANSITRTEHDDKTGEPNMKNRIINGDCTEVLNSIAAESVDFVLTDPPYFVRYKDRSGRTIKSDRHPGAVLKAFDEVYRVLKPNSLCISFYGWQAVDAFMQAWKSAGFTPVGHIVWHKSYASTTRFFQYRHEQAYVLAKGR
jgi:hypothetical protein